MKKYFSSVLTVILGIALITSSAFAEGVTETEKPRLNEAQIIEKLNEIADNYEIGEPLSTEDDEFVKEYVPAVKPQDPDEIRTRKKKSTSVYGYNSNNTVGGSVSGEIWADIGTVNHSFGGSIKTTISKGSAKEVVTKIRHLAFGVVGIGGTVVGIVQNKTLKATCKGSSPCSLNDSHRYMASVAYATTYAEADIKYGNGSVLGIDANSLKID